MWKVIDFPEDFSGVESECDTEEVDFCDVKHEDINEDDEEGGPFENKLRWLGVLSVVNYHTKVSQCLLCGAILCEAHGKRGTRAADGFVMWVQHSSL